jgi:hypothetical protein
MFLSVFVGAPLWWGPLWVFVFCNEFLHLCSKENKKFNDLKSYNGLCQFKDLLNLIFVV